MADLVEIPLELRLDRPRVLALGDAHHAIDDHLAELGLAMNDAFELAGDREKEEIGEADAVDRGGERRGDPGAELGRIREVLQYGHQAQHRAYDAESRRV